MLFNSPINCSAKEQLHNGLLQDPREESQTIFSFKELLLSGQPAGSQKVVLRAGVLSQDFGKETGACRGGQWLAWQPSGSASEGKR